MKNYNYFNDMFYIQEKLQEAEELIQVYEQREIKKDKDINHEKVIDQEIIILNQKIIDLKNYIVQYFQPRLSAKIIDQSLAVIDRVERILKCELND